MPKVKPDRTYVIALQCSLSRTLFLKLGLHNCISKEKIIFDHSLERVYISCFEQIETYVDIISHLQCLTVYCENYVISNSKRCIVASLELSEKKLKQNLNNELSVLKMIIPDNAFDITRANLDEIKLYVSDSLDSNVITQFYSSKCIVDIISEINN